MGRRTLAKSVEDLKCLKVSMRSWRSSRKRCEWESAAVTFDPARCETQSASPKCFQNKYKNHFLQNMHLTSAPALRESDVEKDKIKHVHTEAPSGAATAQNSCRQLLPWLACSNCLAQVLEMHRSRFLTSHNCMHDYLLLSMIFLNQTSPEPVVSKYLRGKKGHTHDSVYQVDITWPHTRVDYQMTSLSASADSCICERSV